MTIKQVLPRPSGKAKRVQPSHFAATPEGQPSLKTKKPKPTIPEGLYLKHLDQLLSDNDELCLKFILENTLQLFQLYDAEDNIEIRTKHHQQTNPHTKQYLCHSTYYKAGALQSDKQTQLAFANYILQNTLKGYHIYFGM